MRMFPPDRMARCTERLEFDAKQVDLFAVRYEHSASIVLNFNHLKEWIGI